MQRPYAVSLLGFVGSLRRYRLLPSFKPHLAVHLRQIADPALISCCGKIQAQLHYQQMSLLPGGPCCERGNLAARRQRNR
ncbi:Uncharacterised protein [Serratia fonticola]|uniref:Uncharacterized protein n=1 Tax=Serratia fonticola TaxID=47917 RepID=A0A448SZC3_SERFO|nr:Uncharacterised protein [Serratia fonticola]